MKTTQFMLVGGAMFAFVACEESNSSERIYEERMDKLEDFVDSLETAVNRNDNHDWATIDSRYNRLTSEVKEAEAGVSDPDHDDWREITDQYDRIKQRATQQSTTNIEAEAEAHLSNVETWWDHNNRVSAEGNVNSRTEGNLEDRAENTADDIEEAAEESLEWLEENFEQLGDNIKERYRKVKADIES